MTSAAPGKPHCPWVDVDADAFASAARDRHQEDSRSRADIESARLAGKISRSEELGHVQRVLTDMHAKSKRLVERIYHEDEIRCRNRPKPRTQSAIRSGL
jgi:hypothetical protein